MTMTLETMLAWCNEFLETAPDARNVESMRDGIRAAILDRDADRFTASNQTLRAEHAEAELAALKARIAQAPLEVVESLPGAVGLPWPRDHWIEVRMADPCACVGQGLIGKRVRLVVEE